MKNVKKVLALCLACILLFGAVPVSQVFAYNVGDIVEYGSYPQTQIKDTVRIDQFEKILADAQTAADATALAAVKNTLTVKLSSGTVFYIKLAKDSRFASIASTLKESLDQGQVALSNPQATWDDIDAAVLLVQAAVKTAVDAATAIDSSVSTTGLTDAEYVSQRPTIWQSYGYYSGTGARYDGKMTSRDFMSYYDFKHGTESYRAVKITTYRPYYVGYATGKDKLTTYQDENGYETEQVYYFHYEPLKWRLLDPSTGLIMCESIIDAQPYETSVYEENGYYYTSTDKTTAAGNYRTSGIRRWLIRDFFTTAFTRAQQQAIPTALITFADGTTASDRVFLPSITDVTSEATGFAPAGSNDSARKASGSDYAKCQGLFVSSDSRNNGLSPWWLRDSAGVNGKGACVTYAGKVENESSTVDLNYVGVRPSCFVTDLISEDELCKFCGKKHGDSFFQRIIAFFHSIFAFIRRTDINMG